MDNILGLIDGIVNKEKLIHGILSNVRKKSEKTFNKVTVKPVNIKNQFMIQFTYHYEKKVTHNNLDAYEAVSELNNLIRSYFKQANIYAIDADYQVLVSKRERQRYLRSLQLRKKSI